MCEQGPWSPRNRSRIPLKCGSWGKLKCPACFSKPSSTPWGCLVGRPHPRILVLFTPQAFLSFGKNCCLAEKPWEALLCLLRNRKSLFAQSKQTRKLQGSRPVQMQSQEVRVGAEDMETRAKNPCPSPLSWPNKQLPQCHSVTCRKPEVSHPPTM